MRRKKALAAIAFIAILLVVCNIYYSEMLHMWPQGMHDWAQADRLSLAINFYDHGMDFFHPRTHNIYSTDGITGVELPLQSYLAAIGGKLTGREHISACFRLLDVLIICTGLLFLFLACYKVTADFICSMFAPLFMFMSPILIYYTCNYVPDSASCALAFISFYFVLDYIKTNSTRNLLLAIGILTLAALIKTSVALYLIGFLGFVLLQRLANIKHFTRHSNISFVIAVVLSVGAIVTQYLYNQYLNTRYNSTVFLAQAKPFKDGNDALFFFEASFKHVWVKEYLLLAQYPVFVAILVMGISLLFRSQKGRQQLRLALIFLLGVACITYMMGSQLHQHDYYAVSIFLPLFAFALLTSVIAIRQYASNTEGLKLLRLGLLSTLLISFFFAYYHSHQRLKPGYNGYSSYEPLWFVGGEKVLAELQVPADEKILVLNEDAPNTALLYLNRRGYHMPPANMRNGNWLKAFVQKLHIKTVVYDASWPHNILNNDTAFHQHFTEVGTIGKVAVYSLKE